MTLRQKVLWIISIITVCLFVSLYTVGSTILQEGFVKVEQQTVYGDVRRVFSALEDSLEKLDKTALDWSAWDATYSFIENLNSSYIRENLSAETLVLLEFNIALFFNRDGKLVYSKGVDLELGQEADLPSSLLKTLASHPNIFRHPTLTSHHRGVLLLPESPLLLASRPILTNQQQGPSRGTLIVGCYLNAAKIQRLMQEAEVPQIIVYPYNDQTLPSDFQIVRQHLTPSHPITTQPLNERLVSGYGFVPDINNQPGLLIRVDIPRKVYQQGQLSLQTFLAILLIAGALFTGVTLVLLERLILKRLGQLTLGIRTVQFTQDLSQRLPIRGHDELSRLGIAINKMLGVLELSQKELRQSQERYQWQANHDALTQLPNRRQFEYQLQLALEAAQTLQQSHVACVMDLDQFKIVNDTCGHAAGDELLCQVAHLLQNRLRRSDLLARLGGDEFGILFYHCPPEKAQEIAQDLQTSLQAFRFVWQDKVFTVGASVGLTQITGESTEVTSILTAADLACYAAKNQGGNRVKFYNLDSSDLQLHLKEMQWAVQIRQALEENRFCLYAQPIVSVRQLLSQQLPAIQTPDPATHTQPVSLSHWEILLRLQDREGKIVPPSVFIPIAERYNLMPAIDRWVVRTLFAQLETQQLEAQQNRGEQSDISSNGQHQPPEYAINLSGSSINDQQFIQFLHEQLSQSQILPTSICFEITETVAISNLKQAVKFINAFREIGCKFSLDDFGSGMSSFAYLQNLPVDYLKIDGTFIQNLTQNSINYEIVRAISSIARLKSIKTIAEFVDNLSLLTTLEELGVDFAQGFGIAKPSPFDSTKM